MLPQSEAPLYVDTMSTVKSNLERKRPWGMATEHAGYFGTSDYRASLLKFGKPYVVVTAVIFLVSTIGADEIDWPVYLLGWGLALASLGFSYTHPSLWMAGPFGALVGAVLVRGATDGFDAGIGPLLMIPAVAVAIYGSRRALMATIFMIALTAIVIHVVNNNEVVINTAWRQDAVLVLLAAVLGLTIQDLVSRMRAERALAASRGRQFQTLANMTRKIATSNDAGESLCDVVIDATGAAGSALLSVDDSRLVVLAHRGADLDMLHQIAEGKTMVPARVVESRHGHRLEVGDAELNLHALAWPGLELVSTTWEPILMDGNVIGILVLACSGDTPTDDEFSIPIDLLAAEGSVAIQQSKATRQLERLATTDALTDIENRRGWQSTIDEEAERSDRNGADLCLALLDLDHFKKYNDQNGHLAGDDLLRDTTRSWKAQLRSSDHIARYGGEEFVVSLADTSLDEAVAIIDRLRKSTPDSITCSAGVAQRQPGESVEALTERADAALYRAKSDGRNRTRTSPEPVPGTP